MKEIRIRNVSADICDLFEALLDRHNLTIPSKDRSGEDGEARIYGDPYSDLEDGVTYYLSKLCDEIRANPDATINDEEY